MLLSDTAQHVLVYARGTDATRTDDDDFVVALNFGAQAAQVTLLLPKAGRWQDLLSNRGYAQRRVTLQLPAAAVQLLHDRERADDPRGRRSLR